MQMYFFWAALIIIAATSGFYFITLIPSMAKLAGIYDRVNTVAVGLALILVIAFTVLSMT
jgi:hypothetical protein